MHLLKARRSPLLIPMPPPRSATTPQLCTGRACAPVALSELPPLKNVSCWGFSFKACFSAGASLQVQGKGVAAAHREQQGFPCACAQQHAGASRTPEGPRSKIKSVRAALCGRLAPCVYV